VLWVGTISWCCKTFS